MTTNTNGDVPSTPDSSAKEKSVRGRKSSSNPIWKVLGVLLFLGCWILFGVVIFNHLTEIGTSVILAAIAAIIGGFIAAVIAWFAGMAGIS